MGSDPGSIAASRDSSCPELCEAESDERRDTGGTLGERNFAGYGDTTHASRESSLIVGTPLSGKLVGGTREPISCMDLSPLCHASRESSLLMVVAPCSGIASYARRLVSRARPRSIRRGISAGAKISRERRRRCYERWWMVGNRVERGRSIRGEKSTVPTRRNLVRTRLCFW